MTTPAQPGGEVAAVGHLDPVELEPSSNLPELMSQLWSHAGSVLPRLDEAVLYQQGATLAIGLEIAAGDEPGPRRKGRT